jgi:hypothetical protein
MVILEEYQAKFDDYVDLFIKRSTREAIIKAPPKTHNCLR